MDSDSDSSFASSIYVSDSSCIHLCPASHSARPSCKRPFPTSKPPKCWTVFGSPRDSWVADIDSRNIRIARDKFGFKVEENTFVITNVFEPSRGTLPMRVGQVVHLSMLSEGHGCLLHMDDDRKCDLCSVVSCRAVEHFVTQWISNIKNRIVTRVLLVGWNAQLPPVVNALVHTFVENAYYHRPIDCHCGFRDDGPPPNCVFGDCYQVQ